MYFLTVLMFSPDAACKASGVTRVPLERRAIAAFCRVCMAFSALMALVYSAPLLIRSCGVSVVKFSTLGLLPKL